MYVCVCVHACVCIHGCMNLCRQGALFAACRHGSGTAYFHITHYIRISYHILRTNIPHMQSLVGTLTHTHKDHVCARVCACVCVRVCVRVCVYACKHGGMMTARHTCSILPCRRCKTLRELLESQRPRVDSICTHLESVLYTHT